MEDQRRRREKENNHDERVITMHPTKFSTGIKPICSTVLDLPPCCIEFVPGDSRYFVVGTYDLQKEESRNVDVDVDVDGESLMHASANQIKEGTSENHDKEESPERDTVKAQSRSGSLILFSLVGEELTLVQTLNHPSAILDLHFFQNSNLFAVVDSTGCISIYSFNSSSASEVPRPSIEHICTHQESQESPLMAVTMSDGTVHLLRFTSHNLMIIEHLNDSEPLLKHAIGPKFAEQPMQAWCCSWVVWENQRTVSLLTGGDDSKIRHISLPLPLPASTDENLENQEEIASYPATFNPHDYGVTAILPLPMPDKFSSIPPVLLTGGYDDSIKVYGREDHFSKSATGKQKVLAERNLGGGVWKLKVVAHNFADGDGVNLKYRILASCMYAGVRMLEVRCSGDGEWVIDVLGEVTVHQSMCYGSEMQRDINAEGHWDAERVFVSTSFYDRLLCVWTFDPKTNVAIDQVAV